MAGSNVGPASPFGDPGCEAITDAVIAVSRTCRCTYVNRSAEDLLGKAREELIGQTLGDVLRAAPEHTFESDIRGAMDALTPGTLVCTLVSPPGRFEIRLYPSVDGLLLLMVDSPGEQQAFRTPSETFYRRLFHTTRDGILVVNADGCYVEANESFCRLVKTERDSVIGSHFSRFIPPERLAEATSAFEALKDGRETLVDFPLMASDGSIVQLEWTATANFFSGYSFCTCREITDRKKQEAALRESEERLRLAQQAARMHSWSFEFSQTGDRTHYEEWLNAVHTSDRQRLDASIAEALQKGDDEFATTCRSVDGERWHEVRGRIQRNSEGTPVGAHGITFDITHRKRADEEQRWVSEQLQTIIKASPLPIVTCTCEGIVTLWNPAAERLFGWKAEEALGGPLPFIPQEKREEHRQMRARDLRGESFTGLEVRRIRKDGSPVDISVSTAPLRDADGIMTGFMSLYVDVTERKRAERELQNTAERLRLALQASRMGDWSFEAWSGSVVLSERAARILGAPHAGACRRGQLLKLIAVEDRKLVGQDLIRCLEESGVCDLEFRVHAPEGERWIWATGQAVEAGGMKSGILGVVQDITARKAAENEILELHRLEKKARRTAEHLCHIGSLLAGELNFGKLAQRITDLATETCGAEFGAMFHRVLDESGESYRLNTLSGAPRERFAGFPMPRDIAVFRGQGVVRSDDITRDARHGNGDPHGDIAEGHAPVRSYLAAPVLSASGEAVAGLFLGHSQPGIFTEQHEDMIAGIAGQAAIALDNARLFDEALRSQAALHRSNEELRRSNEDLEHFAYSASHDLKEPLRQVAVYSQLLQRKFAGTMDPETEQFTDVIVAGARRMDALVRDILAYTQAANIGLEEIGPTDSNRTLSALLEDMRIAIHEAGAQVRVADLPPVRMKPVHLHQLFQNLISNALKYRSQAPPLIQIGADPAGEGWIFFCRDNGIGIAPQFHRQIFSLFKRLHSAAEHEGSGIGLAICQKIVERYGGRIWVESQAGEGATFRFSLPVAPSV